MGDEWGTSEWIAVAAIASSFLTGLVLAALSHRHDRRMRELEHAEQRKARREERGEMSRLREVDLHAEWGQRGQDVATDLLLVLASGLQKNYVFTHLGKEPLDRYDNEIRRRIIMLWKFAPAANLRDAANAVSWWMERLYKDGRVLNDWGADYPHQATRLKVLDRYEKEWGEAMFAVDRLIAALAGDPPPERDSYPLTLMDEGFFDAVAEVEVPSSQPTKE